MDKGPDAFRTISEVAADLDLPQHVLRFWESKFAHIRPMKRGGGRRYYRPDDIELLKGIRYLLYGEGYTIRGVQRILKEQGVRFVMNVWQEGAPQLPDEDDDYTPAEPRGQHAPARLAAGPLDFGDIGVADDEPVLPARASRPAIPFDEPQATSAADIAQRFAPRVAEPRQPAAPEPDMPPRAARPVTTPTPRAMAEDDDSRSALGSLIDRFRGGPAHRQEPGPPAPPPRLSKEEIRQLQSTLFELLECKRLLDQAR